VGRCGRRVLCAVQAGVGIAFSAISTLAARSTASSPIDDPPGCPGGDDRTGDRHVAWPARTAMIAIMTTAVSSRGASPDRASWAL
jgi:hypothetical protein